jgi:hypothetical protein
MQLLHNYIPYIDPRLNIIERNSIYASIITVFAGLFFLENEIQGQENAKLALFLFVLVFNVYFLSQWFFRFGDVVFRTNLNRMREWDCCLCLRHREVNDYN